MLKLVKLSIVSLSILLSVGCASQAPDVAICRSLNPVMLTYKDAFGVVTKTSRANPVCDANIKEPKCGECTFTISDKTVYVGEKEKTYLDGMPWSELEAVSVKMPPKSLGKMKKFIVDTCKQFPSTCKDHPEIGRWRVKLDIISAQDKLSNSGGL